MPGHNSFIVNSHILPRVAAVRPFHSTEPAVILTASGPGFFMWLVNFYLIAPAFGWIWFPEEASQFWQGFVAHTFFYGGVAGWYLAEKRWVR